MCGSLVTCFIAHLPKPKNGYEAITSWIDALSERVYIVDSETAETSMQVSDTFPAHICKTPCNAGQ